MGTTAWYVTTQVHQQWDADSLPARSLEITELDAPPGLHTVQLCGLHWDPGGVETALVSQLQVGSGFVAYLQTDDFTYLLALEDGSVVARYVAPVSLSRTFQEGMWAEAQCAATHGDDWQQSALPQWSAWSKAMPRQAEPDALRRLFAEAEDTMGIEVLEQVWEIFGIFDA